MAASADGAHVKAGVGTICHTIFDTGCLVLIGAKSELAAIESMNVNMDLYERYLVPVAAKHSDRTTADVEKLLNDIDVRLAVLLDDITL